MGGGQVDVSIVLEDFLKEALSLSQLQLLRCIHVCDSLTKLCLRWQTQQQNGAVRGSSSDRGFQEQTTLRPEGATTELCTEVCSGPTCGD